MKELRPYQVEALDRVRGAFSQGKRRVIAVLPTGAGKTFLCGEMAKRSASRGLRTLWLAHRFELVKQAANSLRSDHGLDVGIIAAKSDEDQNLAALVQVSSVNTLLARNLRPDADLVIPDEAHHYVADTFGALLGHYSEAFVVGPTATPQRGDGRALDTGFDALVVGATVSQLTDLGVLVPAMTISPDERLGAREIAQDPVDAYFDHAPGTQAILFARDIEAAEKYAEAFCARGIQARCVHADRPWAERTLYVDAFKAGTLRVLTNVHCLTEGFDHPPTETVILASGAASANAYLQRIGRVLRSAPGKTRALVLDLPGLAHDFGEAEDERLFTLDGDGIRLRDKTPYCPVCGAIRKPAEDCVECGWSAEHSMQAADVIKRRKLAAFVRRQNEGDEGKANRLAYLLAVAKQKGRKMGWARHVFAGNYGAPPTQAVLTRAYQLMAIRTKGAA